MEKLVEKISGLSYELFGILIPGSICFFLVALHVSLIQLPAEGDDLYFYKMLTMNLSSDSPFKVLALVVVVYVLGQIANQLAEKLVKPITKQTGWKKIFGILVLYPAIPSELKSFKDENSYKEALRVLNEHFNIKTSGDWLGFFGPASRLVFQLGLRSKISTHQNKYTLHRILSFVFSVSCRITLVHLVLYCFFTDDFAWTTVWILMCWIMVGFVLSNMFVETFARFWTLFGDQLCWEIQALEFCDRRQLIGKNDSDER